MLHKDLAEFRETRPPETESPPHTLVPCQTFSQLIGEVPILATGKNASLLSRPASSPTDMICRRGQLMMSRITGHHLESRWAKRSGNGCVYQTCGQLSAPAETIKRPFTTAKVFQLLIIIRLMQSSCRRLARSSLSFDSLLQKPWLAVQSFRRSV